MEIWNDISKSIKEIGFTLFNSMYKMHEAASGEMHLSKITTL